MFIRSMVTNAGSVALAAGMMGMSAMWGNDRQEFDNVGLRINVEARGPWGPALLFEACPGNSKVMDLYASNASYPYTYSLTTVVYEFMPNFTDFTIETFKEFIQDIGDLKLDEYWITGDVRPGRGEEKWLNLILQKN